MCNVLFISGLYVGDLNVEYQCGVGSYGRRCLHAVSKFGGYVKSVFGSFVHELQSFAESPDYGFGAELHGIAIG